MADSMSKQAKTEYECEECGDTYLRNACHPYPEDFVNDDGQLMHAVRECADCQFGFRRAAL